MPDQDRPKLAGIGTLIPGELLTHTIQKVFFCELPLLIEAEIGLEHTLQRHHALDHDFATKISGVVRR